MCPTSDCTDDQQTQESYNFRIDLTDHSATVRGCPVNNDVARRMIEVPAEEFAHKDVDYKTNRKWKYMLEMCKIYFKVSSFGNSAGGTVRIISLDLADLREAAKYLFE